MKTQYEIRNPKLDGIFISFDTEWEAMRWWRENIENASKTDMRRGAVVVRHSWEPHHEAESARLDFLLGEGGIAHFSRECLRAPLAHADPKDWLTTARAAIDQARKSPPSTATVIWPNVRSQPHAEDNA